jgi:predicted PurR-regulated permease PerM
VMGLLGIVPVLGAFVVWIPAAIFLTLDGSWGKALILTGWGTAIVGTIDNVLYPMLVGRRLKLHSVLAFISLVGGLILFGPAGFILGPLVVAITMLLLDIGRARMTERS